MVFIEYSTRCSNNKIYLCGHSTFSAMLLVLPCLLPLLYGSCTVNFSCTLCQTWKLIIFSPCFGGRSRSKRFTLGITTLSPFNRAVVSCSRYVQALTTIQISASLSGRIIMLCLIYRMYLDLLVMYPSPHQKTCSRNSLA